MRLHVLRLEAHDPLASLSCASKRDHFEVLKHTAKVVGRRISRKGPMGKIRPKNSII